LKKIEGTIESIQTRMEKIEKFMEDAFKGESDKNSVNKWNRLLSLVDNVGFGKKEPALKPRYGKKAKEAKKEEQKNADPSKTDTKNNESNAAV
jgi:hypothetical protein